MDGIIVHVPYQKKVSSLSCICCLRFISQCVAVWAPLNIAYLHIVCHDRVASIRNIFSNNQKVPTKQNRVTTLKFVVALDFCSRTKRAYNES